MLSQLSNKSHFFVKKWHFFNLRPVYLFGGPRNEKIVFDIWDDGSNAGKCRHIREQGK